MRVEKWISLKHRLPLLELTLDLQESLAEHYETRYLQYAIWVDVMKLQPVKMQRIPQERMNREREAIASQILVNKK